MFFKMTLRRNSSTQSFDSYYRLMESYRNVTGDCTQKTLLTIGVWNDVTPDQLNKISTRLNQLESGKPSLFEEKDIYVKQQVKFIWDQLIAKGKVDVSEAALAKRKKLIYEDSLVHKEAREIGSEWLCYQALEQLDLSKCLSTLGWNEDKIKLTQTQIISRAVYPASELETARWIKENSAICDLTKYPIESINKDKLYRNALSLYEAKDKIEKHLSIKTNELFDIQDKIVLYDLTNTYFEGRKASSKLAKFGKSKEQRKDAKLVVLALVVNIYGFIKYSNVFEGNTADTSTIPNIIDNLRVQTSTHQRAIVVIDAGIASKENLDIIKAKGYDYVCVNRVQLKQYDATATTVKISTKNEDTLEVQKVAVSNQTDYYLKVKSPKKQTKEGSMQLQFKTRFEEELTKISQSIARKKGTKKTEAVNRRIGRQIQKYPSIAKYYTIELKSNEEGIVQSLSWQKDEAKYNESQEQLGVYFLRTNLDIKEEQLLWDIYNTIREIESVFRTLKTDLDLRPIYHKNDNATMAHLHLGLLAYWLVNTIRHQLKAKKINHNWREITRIASTQKIVYSTAQNVEDKVIHIKKCTEPKEKLVALYQALNYQQKPFSKIKSVWLKTETKKNQDPCFRVFDE
jgi:Transposase DDE domain